MINAYACKYSRIRIVYDKAAVRQVPTSIRFIHGDLSVNSVPESELTRPEGSNFGHRYPRRLERIGHTALLPQDRSAFNRGDQVFCHFLDRTAAAEMRVTGGRLVVIFQITICKNQR